VAVAAAVTEPVAVATAEDGEEVAVAAVAAAAAEEASSAPVDCCSGGVSEELDCVREADAGDAAPASSTGFFCFSNATRPWPHPSRGLLQVRQLSFRSNKLLFDEGDGEKRAPPGRLFLRLLRSGRRWPRRREGPRGRLRCPADRRMSSASQRELAEISLSLSLYLVPLGCAKQRRGRRAPDQGRANRTGGLEGRVGRVELVRVLDELAGLALCCGGTRWWEQVRRTGQVRRPVGRVVLVPLAGLALQI
jgi:hypothetical protein